MHHGPKVAILVTEEAAESGLERLRAAGHVGDVPSALMALSTDSPGPSRRSEDATASFWSGR